MIIHQPTQKLVKINLSKKTQRVKTTIVKIAAFLSKNNMPVSDLNLTVRKPIRPTPWQIIIKHIRDIVSHGIDKPEYLKSNTKKTFIVKVLTKTADLPQIDIYKDLSNYEPITLQTYSKKNIAN